MENKVEVKVALSRSRNLGTSGRPVPAADLHRATFTAAPSSLSTTQGKSFRPRIQPYDGTSCRPRTQHLLPPHFLQERVRKSPSVSARYECHPRENELHEDLRGAGCGASASNSTM